MVTSSVQEICVIDEIARPNWSKATSAVGRTGVHEWTGRQRIHGIRHP
jgi:hypothetical protein